MGRDKCNNLIKMKKAQTSTEFTIILGIMMLIFIIFFGVITQRMVKIQAENNRERVKQFLKTITDEILIAQQVENNYYRIFYLPEYIDGGDYTIIISRNSQTDISKGVEIVVDYAGENFVKFVDGKINGTLKKGENRIFKQDGIIQIN
ncbi:MAG: hypothetical protein QXG00_04955 [Candidatus Woesearchaeota archaeon]